jgi:predicted AAA+ superfamily ATPase
MRRYLIDSIKTWKNSPNRKPLLLYGARQVGKTWLIREFAASDYDTLIELNFSTNESLKEIFAENISPKHIIEQLEIKFNKSIDPNRTLLFFDEIQEAQRAMDSLKAFNELAPEYHIAAAGSFLGVMTGRKPVGQTDQLTLYPMSFCEFLEAAGHNMLAEAINRGDTKVLSGLSSKTETLLKQYYYVGGMPAAVLEFVSSGDLNRVREIQNNLLIDYKGDFSKHISVYDFPKVGMLWDSIPVHLTKEKKKFVYKEIKTGARAAEFENAMQWLVDTGMVYKINRIENPQIPLTANQSFGFFKLYMLDIGLFGAKTEISPRDIFSPNVDISDNFNGAMAEQFVCQELKCTRYDSWQTKSLFYWSREKSQAELDFLIQYDGEIIPIEVKSARHTKSKSLQVYSQEYKPKYAVRTSLKNFGVEGNLYSIPLYMIGNLFNLQPHHKC